MTDSEFHTICVMAATLRAGKAGPEDKAWQKALQEAVQAFGSFTDSRAVLDSILFRQSATVPQSATVAESPDSGKPLDNAKDLVSL